MAERRRTAVGGKTLYGAKGIVTATLSSAHRKPRLVVHHAAATAFCHSAVASARKIRSVDREIRCR